MFEKGQENITMLPFIQVLNPMTHEKWNEGRYTTYDITMKTNHQAYRLQKSLTRRRFSEFQWLRKKLKNHHPVVKMPSLPQTRIFFDNFDLKFLEERRKGLQEFLNKLQQETLCLSDSSFHLFVQTSLSVANIERYLQGNFPEEELTHVWSDEQQKAENLRNLHSSQSCPDRLAFFSGSDGDESPHPDSGQSDDSACPIHTRSNSCSYEYASSISSTSSSYTEDTNSCDSSSYVSVKKNKKKVRFFQPALLSDTNIVRQGKNFSINNEN